MLSTLKLVAVGIVVGIANVIPGVSGGTIAVVFNIYDKLLAVITPNIRKIAAQWKFLLPLGAGVLAGILFFAKFISFLFARYPAPSGCFFLGLIAGSIPLVYRKARGQLKLPPVSSVLAAAVMFAVMLVMFFVKFSDTAGRVFAFSPQSALFLTAAGFLAAAAMIIPGISGSFLLLALGVYTTIIGAAGALVDAGFTILRGAEQLGAIFAAAKIPFLIIATVFLGIVAGLFCGAALVRFLLRRLPRQTYGAILGLVAGSLLVVFPGAGAFTGPAITGVSVLCAAAGAALAIFCDVLGKEKQTE
jgi:putative membrane protein